MAINKRNLSSLLVNNKERPKTCYKSGIYKINCTDCEAICKARLVISLTKRMSEHQPSILCNNLTKGFVEHCKSKSLYGYQECSVITFL